MRLLSMGITFKATPNKLEILLTREYFTRLFLFQDHFESVFELLKEV